ncbi:PorP/SprF family type IX secretion system membrane protein [Deminuibacter soli]|uniref:Type IX secretion system membrane protein PorP/SprF n=1 Tax=Deminuibacter soli TaxID=2291815 RepID=A0A3E1NMC9_9BACT|nr:PorP/SprF family type IX secretion system membrane protein [Deminuibacter soli]RFM29086.1 type IX secretion system membrane protein PorP/SprF [Deminuibacter soli]
MKLIRHVLLCCLCYSLCTCLYAQDPHFSQYFTSPMTVNPALTARGVYDWRVAFNTRSQWWGASIKPYYTVTASAEKKLPLGGDNNNYWGIGGMVLSDQSNGGLLKNDYFSLSTSYNISLDGEGRSLLGAGLTGTYANRVLDASKFLFQSQVGSMGFQRDIPSNDPVNIQKARYFDINAGLYYSYTGDAYGWSAGAAMFHASAPHEGAYNNSTYNIPRKVSLQAGGWFKAGAGNSFHLSGFAEYQAGNSIYTLGGIYKIGVSDDLLSSVNIGAWNRFGDALYPYFGLEAKRWIGGISYDIVNSKVKNYQSVQSMELSFVWQLGKGRAEGKPASAVLIY